MSDYIRKYTEKLLGKPLVRDIATVSAVAPLILFAQPDSTHAEERFPGIFNPGRPTQEQIEKSHMPWKRELERIERKAEEFASLATEADMGDPRTRAEFLIENGYTRSDCEKCDLINKPDVQGIIGYAQELGVDPELALAVAYQESNLSHNGKNGKPKMSKKGAYGEFQLTYKAFSEFWRIIREDSDYYYKTYLDEYRNSIRKYAPLFKGKKGEVWERVKEVRKLNRIAGTMFLSFNIHKENGNEWETLRNYGVGKRNKNKYPNNAKEYASSVLGHRDFFENVCPQMESRYNAFKERLYSRRKSRDFTSRYYQRY